MKKILLFVLGIMALTGIRTCLVKSETKEDEERAQFLNFIKKFGKVYKSPEEKEFRFGVFKETLKRIEAVNSDPTKKHRAGLNQFSDWTREEVNSMLMPNGSFEMNRTEKLNSVTSVPEVN